jgi:hypothetical protein
MYHPQNYNFWLWLWLLILALVFPAQSSWNCLLWILSYGVQQLATSTSQSNDDGGEEGEKGVDALQTSTMYQVGYSEDLWAGCFSHLASLRMGMK